MKRVIMIVGVAGIILGGCFGEGAEFGQLAVGDVVPDPGFERLQQSELSGWSELSGRVVLLEFFAHW